ncbi:hypothetical protein PTTG_08633, partial [Puccinia triticina 1-1 BBBD Race 1]
HGNTRHEPPKAILPPALARNTIDTREQLRLPSELTRKATLTSRTAARGKRKSTTYTQQTLAFKPAEEHPPLGIQLDTQCSPLTYQRLHPPEKIHQLNRAHGGWIEEEDQAQAKNPQESLPAQTLVSSPAPPPQDSKSFDERYPMQDLSEPEDDEPLRPDSGPESPRRKHAKKTVVLCPESLDTRLVDRSAEPAAAQASHQAILAGHARLQDAVTNDQERPESWLPETLTPAHSSSCALFFDSSPGRETQHVLCPESIDTRPLLAAPHPGPAILHESILVPSQPDPRLSSCALFFAEDDAEHQPDPDSRDGAGLVLCPSSLETQIAVFPESLLPQTQDYSTSCALFFEADETQPTSPADGSTETGGSKQKVVLAEESQEMPPSPSAAPAASRSLAPPTPISARRLPRQSLSAVPLRSPRASFPKRKSPAPASSSSSATPGTSQQAHVKKKRKSADAMAVRVRPAWEPRPQDIVPKLHPPVLRQTGLVQFLLPSASSPPPKKDTTSQAGRPASRPLPPVLQRFLNNARPRDPDLSGDKGKAKLAVEGEDDEDEIVVSDDDNPPVAARDQDEDQNEDHESSSSISSLSVQEIPDSQPACPPSSSPAPASRAEDDGDTAPEEEAAVVKGLRKRIRLARQREALCRLVLEGCPALPAGAGEDTSAALVGDTDPPGVGSPDHRLTVSDLHGERERASRDRPPALATDRDSVDTRGCGPPPPEPSLTGPGIPPKQPKPKQPKTKQAPEQPKAKPVTRAAAKNPPHPTQSDPTQGATSNKNPVDPEIGEMFSTPRQTPAAESGPIAIDIDNESNEESEQEARRILMAKMIKAEKAGDEVKAERYSKMYEAVLADQRPKHWKTAVDTEVRAAFQPLVIPQKRPSVAGEVTQVRSVKFIVGRTNSHDDGGFTPYFHKLLLECKGPLPLPIFNREWQENALSHHSKNRPKTDETAAEKGLRYHGYPVPDKFSQNFSDWTLNHRVFHQTMRDRYNYPVLAEWILVHKEHCDKLHRKHGFMVALRYDIFIRNNAFAFRVEEEGDESFSDISKFKQETANKMISMCRDFNKINLAKNPYTIGDGRVGGDPIKGIKPQKQCQSNHQSNQQAQPTSAKLKAKAATEENVTSTSGPAPSPPSRKERKVELPREAATRATNTTPTTSVGALATEPASSRNAIVEMQSPPESHTVSAPCESNESRPIWPTKVICEMNIAEWTKALQTANLSDTYRDVLKGFQEGFHQGIPDHDLGPDLPYYTPPNHQGALLAREKIEATIAKEIKAGRMFGPFSHEQLMERYSFFRTNPLGAAVNGDGTVQPINDLSFPRNDPRIPSVNSFVEKLDYLTTWDNFKTTSRFLRRQTQPLLLAIFDWEKAYRQIPTAKSQWRYLMVKDFNGGILIDTRIAFGGVAGCGLFGRPADAWKDLMKSKFDLVEVFRWVDDNLFVKTLNSKVEMDHIVKQSEQLGVKTNATKYSPFKEEQKYIGFVWNTTKKTVCLPNDKKYQQVQQVKAFLTPNAEFSFAQVEQLAGRLNHVSYILPQLRCYLNSLYRWLNDWIHRRTERTLPEDAKTDLEYWLSTLLQYKETRMIQNPDPIEIGWVGNASTGFGIGVLIGKRWAQFQLTQEWDKGPEPKRDIAWLETVTIRIGLIALQQLKIRPGKTLIVWTNNTTTEAVIRQRKSKHPAVNEEWKIIQKILVDMEINIVLRRVLSGENTADALSRGDRSGHDMQFQVAIVVPWDLENRLFQV